MFNKKEKDKYYDMSNELYKRDIIGKDDMLEIKDNYDKKEKIKMILNYRKMCYNIQSKRWFL